MLSPLVSTLVSRVALAVAAAIDGVVRTLEEYPSKDVQEYGSKPMTELLLKSAFEALHSSIAQLHTSIFEQILRVCLGD